MTNLASKTIDALRWPLAALVIMCHAQFLDGFASHPLADWDEWRLLAGWQLFFSEVLPHIAVPLFLLFSGYLLFCKGDMTFARYKTTLAKRARTLLLPYLIWSTICFVVAVSDGTVNGTFMHWLQGLWDTCLWTPEARFSIDMPGYPMSIPLWFLRDLMILVLLSYPLGKLLKWSRGWVLLLIAAWWFPRHAKFFGFGADSLFYFSIGAWFAMKEIDFVAIARKVTIPSYIATAVMTAVFGGLTIGKYLSLGHLEFVWIPFNVFVVCGMTAVLNLSARLVDNEAVGAKRLTRILLSLSASSFWLFAAHIVFMQPLMEALYGLLRPTTQFSNILFYSAFHILYIALLTVLYFVLAKVLPRTMSVLTGGRGKVKQNIITQ